MEIFCILPFRLNSTPISFRFLHESTNRFHRVSYVRQQAHKPQYFSGFFFILILSLFFLPLHDSYLNDASEVKMSSQKETTWISEESKKDDIVLTLPVNKPNVEIPVVELFLK